MSTPSAPQPLGGASRPTGLERWLPAWGWLRRYDRRDLGGDITAGIVVAVMLVPQGMAYAMLAGMPPVAGLYASAIPVLAYVLFGSSRQLAVGPSALTALLTLSGVSLLAAPGSAAFVVLAGTLALMAGLFQLALGLLRAGFVTNFLSSAVINGFTSGAAIIIAVHQLKDLLGVKAGAGAGLVGLVRGLLPHLQEANLPTVAIGAGSVALLLALKRLRVRSLPGPLVVVVLGTLLVGLARLDGAGVAVVGRVPRGLPLPALPAVDPAALPALVPAALALAFVGFMEAIAVGRSIAARERTTVDANRELVGLGLANLVSGLVGGYPLGGGFGRSAVNYEAGARTQLASVVRAALLVLTLVALTPLFTFLPRAVLGAIVFVAVIGLVDVREPVRLFRVRPVDGWTLLVTFAATLFIGVEAGILIGVAFSLLVFVARSAYPHVAELGWLADAGVFRNVRRFGAAQRHHGVLVARPDAALYFANMAFLESWLDDAFRRRADDAGGPVEAVVLDCSAVNDIDAVALEALERRLDAWDGVGVALHLAGVKGPVRDMLARSGFTQRHPERVGHLSVGHALEALGARLEAPSEPLPSEPLPSEPLPSEPSTATSAGPRRRRATGGTP
jgi:SulP family sulfate permease